MIRVHNNDNFAMLINPDLIEVVCHSAGAASYVRTAHGHYYVKETPDDIASMISLWRDAIDVPFSNRAPAGPHPIYAMMSEGVSLSKEHRVATLITRER